MFMGRGNNFPVALEGALKLKEISYIHAEGYPAAELKHGPIALIDENMPAVVICTKSDEYDKMLSNVMEIKARKAIVSLYTNCEIDFEKERKPTKCKTQDTITLQQHQKSVQNLRDSRWTSIKDKIATSFDSAIFDFLKYAIAFFARSSVDPSFTSFTKHSVYP